MRGNIVVAAIVMGVGLFMASCLLVLGLRWAALDAVDRWMTRFDATVRVHGQAVENAGARMSRPNVTFVEPVAIREPLQIRGAGRDGAVPIRGTQGDGSLPVNATLGED